MCLIACREGLDAENALMHPLSACLQSCSMSGCLAAHPCLYKDIMATSSDAIHCCRSS